MSWVAEGTGDIGRDQIWLSFECYDNNRSLSIHQLAGLNQPKTLSGS